MPTQSLECEAALFLLGRCASRKEAGDAIVVLPTVVDITLAAARICG